MADAEGPEGTAQPDGPNGGATGAAPSARRGLFARIAGEPLIQFLVAGLCLFAADRAWQRHHDLYRIEVTGERVAQLAEAYRKQYGRLPDAATREALVEDDVDNEVLYRLGLAQKLDEGDEIVRRRVIQKMRFISEDVAAPVEPDEAAIRGYYDRHAARYATPAQASFTHIFFSADGGGDGAAQRRAARVLAALGKDDATRAPERGDDFPDLYDFSRFGTEQAERLFGHSPFAAAIFTAPVGRWVGPLRSGYGWHLLRVEERGSGGTRPFAEVRDQVRADLLAEAQQAANRRDFADQKRRFTIVRDDRAP